MRVFKPKQGGLKRGYIRCDVISVDTADTIELNVVDDEGLVVGCLGWINESGLTLYQNLPDYDIFQYDIGVPISPEGHVEITADSQRPYAYTYNVSIEKRGGEDE